jgi:hypothetical protein
MRLSNPIPLQTLAGGIAGLIVTVAFFASPLISPVVFYGWYVLAGAIYGAAVGLAVRALLPNFNTRDIAKMSGIVAAGFFATIFIAITLNQNSIVSVAYTAFVLPPLVAIICGAQARRLIVSAGDLAPEGGRPGFFWGALAFSPGFWLFGILVGLSSARILPNAPSESISYVSLIPGTLAGALGGWLSGSLLTRRIRAAFAEEKPAAVDQVTWEAAGETLTVVDAPKDKPKGKPKTYPAPMLPYRVIGVTGAATFVAAWLVFSTLPTLPNMGNVQPPFVPPTATWVYATSTTPLPAPQYAINQKVQVFNLDPSLQGIDDWWVNNYFLSGDTWIYEVRANDGITINRTEAQLAPLPEPTAPALSGLYSRDQWDWRMPLALTNVSETIPEGTLVHIQSEHVVDGEARYIVRDFIGRVATVGENQLIPPQETYFNPQYVDGMPLFGTAQGRIRLAATFGTLSEGTVVEIENAYFDTRTDEWFYYVRLPDGGRMPLRESDLTSAGLE